MSKCQSSRGSQRDPNEGSNTSFRHHEVSLLSVGVLQLSEGSSNLKNNQNLWDSPIFDDMSQLDSKHQENVKILLQKR